MQCLDFCSSTWNEHSILSEKKSHCHWRQLMRPWKKSAARKTASVAFWQKKTLSRTENNSVTSQRKAKDRLFWTSSLPINASLMVEENTPLEWTARRYAERRGWKPTVSHRQRKQIRCLFSSNCFDALGFVSEAFGWLIIEVENSSINTAPWFRFYQSMLL